MPGPTVGDAARHPVQEEVVMAGASRPQTPFSLHECPLVAFIRFFITAEAHLIVQFTVNADQF